MLWFMTLLKFFNDNSGLVTFVVGFFAIYLYLKQRKDRKRDAARLILQEIRYAEQQIRNAKINIPVVNYSLASKLLPTNSWNANIHLFIKDLKETEIDMISLFYSKTSYIDSLIAERTSQKISPPQMPTVQFPPASPSVTGQPVSPVGSPQLFMPQQVMKFIQDTGNITNALIAEVSSSVEFLYNTPAAEKLRKISERKWYQLV